MMSLNTHVLNAAPRRLVSRVTPLTTAAQQVVTSFAVAGLTGYLTSRTADHIAKIGPEGNPLQAAVSAYSDTFLLSTGLAIIGILLSFILRKPKPQPEDKSDIGSEKADPAMMMGH
ncbi:hypothetical protein [Cohnella silvisoli]|uniref:hypothetical protein n=1 Tax=Cohnella silvisoli TaxID=2873699 RepID=UPI002814DE6B|nr:hypothetical protein [Cohnella silvisoli]